MLLPSKSYHRKKLLDEITKWIFKSNELMLKKCLKRVGRFKHPGSVINEDMLDMEKNYAEAFLKATV